MAVRGITFSKQMVSSNDDSHIYEILLNGRTGRTKGCKMTYGKDDIYISEGYFFISNRLIEIPSTETISTPVVTTGTTYCRLVFELDFSKTNTSESFNQGAFRILSSVTNYPEITQENLAEGGNIYQMPFAKFTKSINGISTFVSELETVAYIKGEETTIYVSTSGSDASGDGSESYPFKTIQHAINSIPKSHENRKITINVASGTYAEDIEISGFFGVPVWLELGTVSVNALSVYDSLVIIEGTGLTVNANGKTYGVHCHRGGNLICQIPIVVNGSTYGVYVGYGSHFEGRSTVTANSCTYAATVTFAAMASIATLAGSKNNNAVQASGGICALGTVVSGVASTLYVTSSGGRIYTGAQASVPTY